MSTPEARRRRRASRSARRAAAASRASSASTARSAALGVDVEIVSLVAFEDRGGRRRDRARACASVRVPMTRRARPGRVPAARACGRARDATSALALHPDLTPAYGEALADGAAAAVGRGREPPVRPARARGAPPTLPLIYEAHNVETDLKASMLAESEAADELDRRGARRRGGVLRDARRTRSSARPRTASGSASCSGCRPSARSSCPTASTPPPSRSPTPRRARSAAARSGWRRAARALPRLLARAEPRRGARRARRRGGAARRALPGRRQRGAGVRRRARAAATSTSAASSTTASCAACSALAERRAQPDALGLGDQPEDARLRARRRADRSSTRSARAGSASSPAATTRRSSRGAGGRPRARCDALPADVAERTRAAAEHVREQLRVGRDRRALARAPRAARAAGGGRGRVIHVVCRRPRQRRRRSAPPRARPRRAPPGLAADRARAARACGRAAPGRGAVRGARAGRPRPAGDAIPRGRAAPRCARRSRGRCSSATRSTPAPSACSCCRPTPRCAARSTRSRTARRTPRCSCRALLGGLPQDGERPDARDLLDAGEIDDELVAVRADDAGPRVRELVGRAPARGRRGRGGRARRAAGAARAEPARGGARRFDGVGAARGPRLRRLVLEPARAPARGRAARCASRASAPTARGGCPSTRSRTLVLDDPVLSEARRPARAGAARGRLGRRGRGRRRRPRAARRARLERAPAAPARAGARGRRGLRRRLLAGRRAGVRALADAPARHGAAAGLGPYALDAWKERRDLRDAFGDLEGEDAEGFVGWLWVHGRAELGLAEDLLPPAARGRRRPTQVPPVLVTGYLRGNLGLGEAARGYTAALQAAGVPVATSTLVARGARSSDAARRPPPEQRRSTS